MKSSEKWHYTKLNLRGITLEEAKGIANKIKFTQGEVAPAKQLDQFDGLQPDSYQAESKESQSSESSNTTIKNNTGQELQIETLNTIEIERRFNDGPLSFGLPTDHVTDVLSSYIESLNTGTSSYWIQNGGFSMLSPTVQTVTWYESLDAWGTHQVNSWKSSELNSSISAYRFTTESGYPGIYVTRKYDSHWPDEESGKDQFEYIVTVDLTTKAWKDRYLQGEYAVDTAWLMFQERGSVTNTSNNLEISLGIAKSLDYNQSKVPSMQDVEFQEEPILLNTKELGFNWFESGWFGVFFESFNGWIYHEDLGWLYAEEASSDKTWIWAEKKGWLWTSKEVFPYLYSDDSNNWVYVVNDSSGPTKAFDYNPKEWTKWQDLTLIKIANPNIDTSASDSPLTKEIKNILNTDGTDNQKINSIAEAILKTF